jgi:hypothetical protein
MPSHLETCVLCNLAFGAGETRQPHPLAGGIGYGKAHKDCAAKLTRKGRALAGAGLPVVHQPEPVPEPVPVAVLEPEPPVFIAQYENDATQVEPEPEPHHKKRGKHS